MSAPASTTVDVAAVLQRELQAVMPDVRVYPYVADAARVPCVVIGQPELDFANGSSGFCRAEWTFPLGIVVSRNQDKAAQAALSSLVADVANALQDSSPSELFSVEPLDARPAQVTANGQDLPGYTLRVRVRA